MMDWTPEEDKTLQKLKHRVSVYKIAKSLNRTDEQVRYRIRYLVEIEKTGFDIDKMLAEFPELSPGQRQMAINISQYEPQTARRYCESIRQFRIAYKKYNPERIGEGNESTNLRFHRNRNTNHEAP